MFLDCQKSSFLLEGRETSVVFPFLNSGFEGKDGGYSEEKVTTIYIYELSPCRVVNTLQLGYKNQPS
jgi:hypothetical protein